MQDDSRWQLDMSVMRQGQTFSSTAVKAGLKDSRLWASSVRTGRSFSPAAAWGSQ